MEWDIFENVFVRCGKIYFSTVYRYIYTLLTTASFPPFPSGGGAEAPPGAAAWSAAVQGAKAGSGGGGGDSDVQAPHRRTAPSPARAAPVLDAPGREADHRTGPSVENFHVKLAAL